MSVLDIGGGKRPAISPQLNEELALHVIGLDIDQNELESAPPGAYDETVVSDAASFTLSRPVDAVVSHYVVEHVEDVRSMFQNVYECLAPGGLTFHHIPNRYSVASTLNRMLPQTVKLQMLHALHPERRHVGGYPAHYDNCTPSAMLSLLSDVGFTDVHLSSVSFSTSYFKVFFPVYFLMTCWELAVENLELTDLCTDFIVEARVDG